MIKTIDDLLFLRIKVGYLIHRVNIGVVKKEEQ